MLFDPTKPPDLKSRELGLYLIAALDGSLDAAKQVLALTESALPEGSPELAKNIVQNAGEELRKAEIAIRTVHHHYANGTSFEDVERVRQLAVALREQAERLPDHLDRMAVDDDDPVLGRGQHAGRAVALIRSVHEIGLETISLIGERDSDCPLNAKAMLLAMMWQAIVAVEMIGSAVRDLTRLR